MIPPADQLIQLLAWKDLLVGNRSPRQLVVASLGTPLLEDSQPENY